MTARAASALALLSALLLLPSCGGSDAGGPGPADTTPPTIIERSILGAAADVGLIERIEITFSEAMDPLTIDDTTLYVRGRAPRGFVCYDPISHTASFTPDTLYAADAAHAFVVSGSVTDAAGNALGEPDTTLFETGPFDCEHLDDYLEPNDTLVEAAEVVTDIEYPTLSVCGSDPDCYVFTIVSDATVTARTAIKHAEGVRWSMCLLEQGGAVVASHADTIWTDDEALLDASLPGGIYTVTIASDDDPIYVLYALELETGLP